MNTYQEYLNEIEERKTQGLSPKPIDGSELTAEIIAQIKDSAHEHRKESLNFFIYNTLPGTTSAAIQKANFLRNIIIGEEKVEEIKLQIEEKKEEIQEVKVIEKKVDFEPEPEIVKEKPLPTPPIPVPKRKVFNTKLGRFV